MRIAVLGAGGGLGRNVVDACVLRHLQRLRRLSKTAIRPTVRNRLVTVRRPVVRMAATPNSLARTKVAAVVKADSKRENTDKGSLVILGMRASGLQKQERASDLHATAPEALLV